MPSGNIEIVHVFSDIPDKVILTIAENANPSAEVRPRIVLNPPHIDGDVSIFDNLNLVLHRIKCYESSDGVTLETLLHEWTVQAKKSKPVLQVYHYIVDRGNTYDPVTDTDSITDDRLKDAVAVVIFRDGGELQHPNVNYNLLTDGGWQLLNGDKFSNFEKWTVIAAFNVDVVESGSASSSSSASTGDINVVSADADFGTDYYGKKNVAAFTSLIGTTDFPTFSTIPSGTSAKFSTYTGAQRYWKLQFASGDTVHYNGEDRNVLYLRKNQFIELQWKDGTCYIVDSFLETELIGRRVFVDRWDFATGNNGNKILLDGTQYNLADFPGFDDEHLKKLDPSQIVTITQWNSDATKQGFYAIDRTSGVFIVPKDLDMHYRALKTNDGVNGMPGSYQADMLKDHQHEETIGTLPTTVFGRGGTNPNKGNYDRVQSGTMDLSGHPVDGSGVALTVGNETAVKARRQYVAVYI